ATRVGAVGEHPTRACCYIVRCNAKQLGLRPMAPVRELRRLFEAISRKDWEAAQAVAEQLAGLEAKRGNRAAARALRDSLHHHNGSAPVSASILELGLSRRNTAI